MKRVPVILLALTYVSAGPSLAVATEFRVAQKGQQFNPRTLTIKAGDEVVFVNDDTGTHNVFSESATTSFDLKAQRPGASTRVAFPKVGKVDVRCAIHPSMRMTIEVE
ncbi:Cupredoxin-like domain-containing protein [Bosea sp. 62]|uniref:cupredoxin domain-containing protein n=1 Tax=unclassified Bosea (in: a-proteobacteria) TaxID=2653178 RepID=UPI0012564F49|nr:MULTISPECIES: plastocyanin/azurin family copper-binding protein [unclassified Bosea (in: a-proteobacteria)]CAD5293874.1 Cupredoxin-like domain-containing protein [Bosea sp. 21B]CAD5294483.1 Cupredoxin-like domain-containing protein [Bosea sp. 46]CAD5299011.1 Cupredoxin-like domain-containing protein [Bosea sp. 7B]VVT60816.1 Cupredoxin-like domain-containing protein [Bosea sp. EC-HK365B]VXB40367.1 Cupredoxin-like domain-containing protein [Bosea sp. 127]